MNIAPDTLDKIKELLAEDPNRTIEYGRGIFRNTWNSSLLDDETPEDEKPGRDIQFQYDTVDFRCFDSDEFVCTSHLRSFEQAQEATRVFALLAKARPEHINVTIEKDEDELPF